jgi:hypothetical protein
MPRRSVREALTFSQPPLSNDSRLTTHDSPAVSETTLEVRKQIHASLRMAPLPEAQPTVPQEGHTAEWPLWAYSKKMSTVTRLRIDYEDGTYFLLKAPEGMPSVLSPGYLDVLWHYGQKDLFEGKCVEISAYRLLSLLHQGPVQGKQYQGFIRDMKRHFALYIETDRLIDPGTHQRSHTSYFRVLEGMELARNGKRDSRFYFNDIFLRSFRSGYLRRLDLDFCLHLDRQEEPLARFLYGHVAKRLGDKSVYVRSWNGFLTDVGLGHLAQLPAKRQTERVKRLVFPALDRIKGHACDRYELDGRGNIFFFSLEPRI